MSFARRGSPLPKKVGETKWFFPLASLPENDVLCNADTDTDIDEEIGEMIREELQGPQSPDVTSSSEGPEPAVASGEPPIGTYWKEVLATMKLEELKSTVVPADHMPTVNGSPIPLSKSAPAEVDSSKSKRVIGFAVDPSLSSRSLSPTMTSGQPSRKVSTAVHDSVKPKSDKPLVNPFPLFARQGAPVLNTQDRSSVQQLSSQPTRVSLRRSGSSGERETRQVSTVLSEVLRMSDEAESTLDKYCQQGGVQSMYRRS